MASSLFCHDIPLFKTAVLVATSGTELDHDDLAISCSIESDRVFSDVASESVAGANSFHK